MFRVVPIRGVSHFTGGFLLQHDDRLSLNGTVSSAVPSSNPSVAPSVDSSVSPTSVPTSLDSSGVPNFVPNFVLLITVPSSRPIFRSSHLPSYPPRL